MSRVDIRITVGLLISYCKSESGSLSEKNAYQAGEDCRSDKFTPPFSLSDQNTGNPLSYIYLIHIDESLIFLYTQF